MIKRKVVTFICIILALLLQTTIFRKLALSDVVPNILLALTVSYGYLRGRTSGMLTGFFCGLILDCAYGSVIGLYAFIMMSIGFVIGFCQKIYFRNSLVLPLVLIAGSDFIYCIYLYVTEFLMRGKLNFIFYFIHRILPEVVYTTLVGILVYRLIAAAEKLVSSKREEV